MQEEKLRVPEELKSPDAELKAQITNKIENDDFQKALQESAMAAGVYRDETGESEAELIRMALLQSQKDHEDAEM